LPFEVTELDPNLTDVNNEIFEYSEMTYCSFLIRATTGTSFQNKLSSQNFVVSNSPETAAKQFHTN